MMKKDFICEKCRGHVEGIQQHEDKRLSVYQYNCDECGFWDMVVLLKWEYSLLMDDIVMDVGAVEAESQAAAERMVGELAEQKRCNLYVIHS